MDIVVVEALSGQRARRSVTRVVFFLSRIQIARRRGQSPLLAVRIPKQPGSPGTATRGSKIGNFLPVSTLQSRVESYDSGRSIGLDLLDILDHCHSVVSWLCITKWPRSLSCHLDRRRMAIDG